MGSYDTLVAGETLGDGELVNRSLKRLRDLHAYVEDSGTFTEYNSPTYTMIDVRDLATFRHHVRHPEAKPMVDDLFRLAWEVIAHHFHAPTRQWSGPNSRSYNVLTRRRDDRNRGVLRTIEEWATDAVDFGLKTLKHEPEWACMDARCPADLESYFISTDSPRSIVELMVKREPLAHVATTYLTPEVSLGSINHRDTWNQRRNVLAFWGTHDKPCCLKVRLIYDRYDLSTDALWTQQTDHCVLGALTFATDGGGKHLSLEKLDNGTYEAAELALRFEFSGFAAEDDIRAPSSLAEPACVSSQEIDIGIHVPYAHFDQRDIRWDRTNEGAAVGLDLTIHRGETEALVLPETNQAIIGFALQVGGNGTIEPAQATAEDGRMEIAWKEMGFSVPTKPDTYEGMRKAISGIAG